MTDSNEQIMVEFVTEEVLSMLKAEGHWGAPDPAPLDGEAVERAMHTIMRHENYEAQTLIVMDKDLVIWVACQGDVMRKGT